MTVTVKCHVTVCDSVTMTSYLNPNPKIKRRQNQK